MESLPDETLVSVSPLVSLHPALAGIRTFLCAHGAAAAEERERTFVLVHDVELRLEFLRQKGIVQQFLRRNGLLQALRKVSYRQLVALSAFLPMREYIEARFGRNICGSGYALVTLDGLDSWFAQSRTFKQHALPGPEGGVEKASSSRLALREFERRLDRAEKLLAGLGAGELRAARARVLRLLETLETAPTVTELPDDRAAKGQR